MWATSPLIIERSHYRVAQGHHPIMWGGGNSEVCSSRGIVNENLMCIILSRRCTPASEAKRRRAHCTIKSPIAKRESYITRTRMNTRSDATQRNVSRKTSFITCLEWAIIQRDVFYEVGGLWLQHSLAGSESIDTRAPSSKKRYYLPKAITWPRASPWRHGQAMYFSRGCSPTSPRAVAYRGGEWFGVFNPPKFWRPSKIVPNSTRLWKLLKSAEFRTPTHQDVRKKGSNIPKLSRFTIVLH